MKRFIKYRWMLLLHVFFMVVASLLYPHLTDETYHYYFQMIAFAWCIPPLFLLWCFYKSKMLDVLIIFSFFAVNNLLDELFFDPQKIGLNEVIFAIATIITTLIATPCIKTNGTNYGNK